MRSKIRLGLLLAGLVLVWVSLPGTSVAAGSSCSNGGNWFAGYDTNYSNSRWGSRATIEYNNPDLCGNDTSGPSASTAWVMISGPSQQVGQDDYAQSGYGQFADGSTQSSPGFHTFVQWTSACFHTHSCGSNLSRHTMFEPAPTGASVYRVSYRGGPGDDQHFHMYRDGGYIDETNYNPVTVWTGTWRNSFEGEALHAATDVVGTADDPTRFTGVSNQNGANPTWTTISNSSLDPSTPSTTRYHKEKYAPSDFRIWTNPLTYP